MQLLKRTVYCGQVTETHLDTDIILNGWVARRRDHGGVIFVDLRDRAGIVQLVFDPTSHPEAAEMAHALRSEFVIAVRGTVIKRAPAMTNDKLATGQFEVKVSTLQILNKSNALPFQLDEEEKSLKSYASNIATLICAVNRCMTILKLAMTSHLPLETILMSSIFMRSKPPSSPKALQGALVTF